MIALFALLAAAYGPVQPQDGPAQGCARSTGGAIVVCKRRAQGGESRFRLPLRDQGFDPNGPIDSVSRATHRLLDADGGAPDYTRGSCSAVGADGWTGCQIKAWRERDQQKGQ